MRRRLTKQHHEIIQHGGNFYEIPNRVLEKYCVTANTDGKDKGCVSPDELFADLDQKYTKPGALLRGLRIRENLTQIELAKEIKVTQSDISQMEHGRRAIGRTVAQRIAKLFDVDYRSFLE